MPDDTIGTVWLGNSHVVEVVPVRDGNGDPAVDAAGRELKQRRHAPHSTWTEVGVVAGATVKSLYADIANPGGVWAHHSDAKAPAWVASDIPGVAEALAGLLGCPVADIPADAQGARAH